MLEENKKCLAFVTQRILCSLSNALHRFQNLPAKDQPLPREIVDYRATEVEVGRGLVHISEALQYTHYVGRRLHLGEKKPTNHPPIHLSTHPPTHPPTHHLGLSPEAVFITPQGSWKLGGFGFSITLSANEIGR